MEEDFVKFIQRWSRVLWGGFFLALKSGFLAGGTTIKARNLWTENMSGTFPEYSYREMPCHGGLWCRQIFASVHSLV